MILSSYTYINQVCRVYSLTRGEQLLAVSFTSPLTSLAVDAMESTVYVGCQSGTISQFSLQSPPREVAVTADSLQATSLEGHSTSVTVLSLSMDGRTLASGAEGMASLFNEPLPIQIPRRGEAVGHSLCTMCPISSSQRHGGHCPVFADPTFPH